MEDATYSLYHLLRIIPQSGLAGARQEPGWEAQCLCSAQQIGWFRRKKLRYFAQDLHWVGHTGTNWGQPRPTAALTPQHHREQQPQGSPSPCRPWGLPLLTQPSGDLHALFLQNTSCFGLGCCSFFLIPNIIFAIRLTEHFHPIQNRLMSAAGTGRAGCSGQGRCGLLLDPLMFSLYPSAALRVQRRPLPSTSPTSRHSGSRPGVCWVWWHTLHPRSSCQARARALQGSRSLRCLFLSLLQGLSIYQGRSQSLAEPGCRGRLPTALANRWCTPCTGRPSREGRPPTAPQHFPVPGTDPQHGPTGAPQEGAHERHRASLP